MHVYVTREIPESGLKQIRKKVDSISVYQESKPIPKERLMQEVGDVDGLLCLLTDEVDRDVIENASQLKVISNYAVGYENIDIDAATEQNIMVTNTPGVLTKATAELSWALLLSTVRKVLPSDQFVRDGSFNGWSPTLYRGLELNDSVLGIIGAGRIGRTVGRIAKGFEMEVKYLARSEKPHFEEQTNAQYVDLSTLLAESDVVSIHLPLTPETRQMITSDELSQMKEGSYLINTGRGSVIDEAALVNALENNQLAGAGLDVYENEPDVHPELIDRDDVVLTPHIGSATYRTRDQMAELAAKDLLDGLKGNKPNNLINEEVMKR